MCTGHTNIRQHPWGTPGNTSPCSVLLLVDGQSPVAILAIAGAEDPRRGLACTFSGIRLLLALVGSHNILVSVLCLGSLLLRYRPFGPAWCRLFRILGGELELLDLVLAVL